MDIENVKKAYLDFQNKNPGFGNLMILDKEGKILFSQDPNFAKDTEGKQLMEAWLGNKPAVEIGGVRYPILKWDPIQFAARNTGGKGALIGSITKSGLYGVIALAANCSMPLIAASTALNRFSWNLF